MILAVNAGNVLVSAGVYDRGAQIAKTQIASHRHTTGYEYSYKFESLFRSAGISAAGITGAIVSPVNPICGAAVAQAVRLACGVTPIKVGPGIRTGLDILLKDPGGMGADLVAVSVAALDRYRPPMVIVFIGAAALVIIAINAKGKYLGGSIAPSPGLALSALCKQAAYLPDMGIEQPVKLIGSDSREAISSGVVYGTAAMVRGMVQMVVDKVRELSDNSEVRVVITGSAAPDILPHIGLEAKFDSELLLDGLNLLYRRNTQMV
ncbi:MAG: type III pantothenate kinase [Defluviitaleaceae bacterium]|nr:type III pantothenate kinase [Defluviitaleaceae bacterium]